MSETGFYRPSLKELKKSVRDDLRTRLVTDPGLRRSDTEIQATVQAGALHGLYGYLDWQARQILPDTAEDEFLARHASLWGIYRKVASTAQGVVRLSGFVGSVIPAGTILQSPTEQDFITTAEALIEEKSVTVAIAAVEAGTTGNLPTGAVLSLVSPIIGVDADAVCIEDMSGGADLESMDSLRARLLERIRQPPHGGADFDYTMWALQVPGVTRAWVYPLFDGPGTVGLAFVMDDRDDPTPLPGDVAQVQAHIDALRPVTANVTVFAPAPVAFDLGIQLAPDTSSVRAAVAAEVREFLRREAEPGGTIWRSRVSETIARAIGEHHHTLFFPTDDITHGFGQIAVPGTIRWGTP